MLATAFAEGTEVVRKQKTDDTILSL